MKNISAILTIRDDNPDILTFGNIQISCYVSEKWSEEQISEYINNMVLSNYELSY